MQTPRAKLIAEARPLAAALALCVGTAWPSVGTALERDGGSSRRVDAIFVLDNSGSMAETDPDRATRQLVTGFAVAMPRGGRLGVVLFDATATLVEPLTRSVGPGSEPRWSAVMSRLDYSGQLTNSPAGIERALYELQQSGREGAGKAIVLVTDGIVDTGDPRRDVEKTRWLKVELAEAARRDGVRIFGIALTDSADVELIQALALQTGGAYWRAPRADDVAGVLADVGRHLTERPTLAPASTAADHPPLAAPDLAEGLLARVSSAPPDRSRGLLLLGLGGALGAVVLLYPLVDRRRRRVRLQRSVFADAGAAPLAPPPLPALPRGGRPPIVKLVDEGDALGRGHAVLLLEKRSTRIGRDPESDVAIPSDTVSSFHATIDYADGYFHVEDQRSTNGTCLNGLRLGPGQRVRLKSGDRIGIAGHDLRFLIPDHEPRGRTAALGGTTLPDAGDASRTRGAAASEPRSGPAPVSRLDAAFEQCLTAHLVKIETLGPDHRRFVARAFSGELRGLLRRRAEELISRGRETSRGEQADWARAGVHYTLCVIPEAMEGARDWYVRQHGGYARFLVERLDACADAGRGADALCVVTFGRAARPWLSITIVPTRDDVGAIEVMSYEFLSEDERRLALEPDREVSLSG